MFAEFCKKTIAFFMWAFVAVVALGLSFAAVLADYMGLVSAFERLNYEQKEILYDKLIGPYLNSLCPGATLVQTYALIIVSVKMLFLLLATHMLGTIWKLVQARVEYEANTQDRRRANQQVLGYTAIFGIFGVPAAILMYWDFMLFRYRAVADAMNLGSMEAAEAVLNVPSFEIYCQQNSELFAPQMIGISAWGYTALAIVGCLGLEYARLNMEDSFTWPLNFIEIKALNVWSYLRSWLPGRPKQYDAYSDEYRYSEEDSESGYYDYAKGDGEQEQWYAPEALEGDGTNPTEGSEASVSAGSYENLLCDVIGASPGTQITRETALADRNRYYVDTATGKIYDAAFWKTLHGVSA